MLFKSHSQDQLASAVGALVLVGLSFGAVLYPLLVG